MTTQANTPVRRVFRYGDKVFQDPGAEHTIEQIRVHLCTYFPELGHAKTEEKTLDDGTLEISFSKQVTRKGSTLPKGAL